MVGLLGYFLITHPLGTEVRLDSPKLTVSFRTDRSIFPTDWQTDEIKPLAEPIAESDEPKCIATIKTAIAKYPRAVTETNLKTVYVSRNLSFYGLNYGGTNSLDAVYLLLTPWEDQNFNQRFLERALHHEFSSILLRNHIRLFPQIAWDAALPKDFVYRGDGTQSLREGTAHTNYEEAYNQRGFLAEYSTSSLEEDFNLFAEAIFSGDKEFWKIYDRCPALAKKADIVMDFYHAIDPVFAKAALRQLAQAQTR